jgi:uncharacterized membrane protein YkoI
MIFEGEAIEGGVRKKHRFVSNVTSLTKVIGGVRTVVGYDLDYSDGELVESEIYFLAQDDAGNIWRFGEYPEEWEEDEVIDTPTWMHGVDGALAGINMLANPTEGSPSYAQGWGPMVSWDDRGQVYKMGVKHTVPHATYEDVLIIDETSAQEPGAHQLKYFAKGVGNFAVGFMGDDPTQEVLELVTINTLSERELKKVDAAALEQEKRAYELSPDIYGKTEPIEGHKVARKAGKGTEPQRKITDEQAREIALQAMPGKYMAIKVERKMGAKRLVVEVIGAKDGKEWDVIIDMETGEVLAVAD